MTNSVDDVICLWTKQASNIFELNRLVLSSFLYACGSWVTYRRHTKRLERFHQQCIRTKSHYIRWQSYTSWYFQPQSAYQCPVLQNHFTMELVMSSRWRTIGSLSSFCTMNWLKEKKTTHTRKLKLYQEYCMTNDDVRAKRTGKTSLEKIYPGGIFGGVMGSHP